VQQQIQTDTASEIGDNLPENNQDSADIDTNNIKNRDSLINESLDTIKSMGNDTLLPDSMSEETGYIPVEEFNADGRIFTVQIMEAQENRMKFDNFTLNKEALNEDNLFCIPNSEGKYIFVAGKFKKLRKAARLQKEIVDNYPKAKVIEVVEGNMLKEN
ncbi:MAG: hypothetical protein ACOCPM_01300, partial [Bacteroidales bacterium]